MNVEVELTDAEWYQLMQWAHKANCTLNELCNEILSDFVADAKATSND